MARHSVHLGDLKSLRAANRELAERLKNAVEDARVLHGLLGLLVESALGNLDDEYVSVPTQYMLEAARLVKDVLHA